MREKKTIEKNENILHEFGFYLKRVLFGVVILLLFVVLLGIDRYAQNTELAAKNQEEFDYFMSFSMELSDGSGTFTQDNLKDYKITVINGWGDWCQSCIDEMPDLQKLSVEYTDKGLQVVGVVADYYDYSNKDELDKNISSIIESTGVTYPNMVSDERFMQEVEPMMNGAFPGTWVVDSEGKLIDFVSGGRSEETWRTQFDEWLAEVN